MQRAVDTSTGQQAVMRSFLHHSSMFQYQDMVGIAHCTNPVTYDDCGPPLHHRSQFAEDGFFGGGIHCAQGIIEEQDARTGDDGARDAHPLFLATTEGNAALPKQRVVTLGEADDIFMHLRRSRRFLYALVHIGAGIQPEGDVVADAVAEEEYILRYTTEL